MTDYDFSIFILLKLQKLDLARRAKMCIAGSEAPGKFHSASEGCNNRQKWWFLGDFSQSFCLFVKLRVLCHQFRQSRPLPPQLKVRRGGLLTSPPKTGGEFHHLWLKQKAYHCLIVIRNLFLTYMRKLSGFTLLQNDGIEWDLIMVCHTFFRCGTPWASQISINKKRAWCRFSGYFSVSPKTFDYSSS